MAEVPSGNEKNEAAAAAPNAEPQLLNEAPKANDAVQFYTEEVGRTTSSTKKAGQEVPKLGDSVFSVSDLPEDAAQ